MGTVALYGIFGDLLSTTFITCTLVTIIIDKTDSYNASSVGLILTQLLALHSYLQYCIKVSTDILNNLAGAERIFEYTRLTNEENIKKNVEQKPIQNWPNEGLIEFRTLYMKYSPNLPYSLQNINLTIWPGEKVYFLRLNIL